MEVINPEDIKKLAKAREIITTLQSKLYHAENCLDDLSRAVEIAQFTKQYHVTEVFVGDAAKLLEDRLVIPERDQSDAKYTVIEGQIDKEVFDDLVDVVKDKNIAPTKGTSIGIDRDLKAVGHTIRRDRDADTDA